LLDVNAGGLRFESFTSRRDAFNEDPTKGVILAIDGAPDTRVKIRGGQPGAFRMEHTLAELMASSASAFTGPFTSESVLVHRLLTPESYRLAFTWSDERDGSQADYYMIRVTQSNGQMAWSSPVWVA